MATRVLPPHPTITEHTDDAGQTLVTFSFDEAENGHLTTNEQYLLTDDDTLVRRCDYCNINGIRREFRYIYGGVCFHCSGSGLRPTKGAGTRTQIASAYRKRQVHRIYTQKKAEERRQARLAAREAFLQANPEFTATLHAWRAAIEELARDSQDCPTDNERAVRERITETARTHTPALMHIEDRYYDFDSLTNEEMNTFIDGFTTWQQRRTEAENTRYAGEIGDTITITGTVVYETEVPGHYKDSLLAIIKGTGANAGTILKFYSTARWVWGLRRGHEITVAGTVKKHTTNKDNARVTVLRAPRKK